ncbi:hypothetical protein [Bradyrhizobium sp. dw_411]|uniref:hypothetical protein n=1 Tax=Bradyrhizobium sp. dw_411 TaxID=2720082 RepID=UPI001BCBD554|nr:hypothetical protein [Bradyrhizobium sp. dw_411]
MKWIKERDLFIAQTMAFVQSVTGKKPAAEARMTPLDLLFQSPLVQSPLAQSAPVDEIAAEDRRVEILKAEAVQAAAVQTGTLKIETAQSTLSSPAITDVRQEIRGRIAAFRAHQELFHRERDAYYNSVLTRVHAATGHASGAPDDQPSKS